MLNNIIIKILYYYYYINNIIISNFNVKIHAYQFNNKLYYIKYFNRLYPFIPFKIILNYFNVKLIYSINNIYFITNYSNSINPVILNLEIINSNNNKINLTKNIQNYNSMIPLKFILDTNILNAINLNIKYISNNKLIEKNMNLCEHNNLLLKDIFNKN